MKNLLKSEIKTLAEKILQDKSLSEVSEMKQMAKALYEKLTILSFVEENISKDSTKEVEEEEVVSKPIVKEESKEVELNQNSQPKEVVETEFEDNTLISTLDENLFVSEEPIDEELIEPATEKIKDIVAQMSPETEQVDALLETVIESKVEKNDMIDVAPQYGNDSVGEGKSQSLNDRLKKGITIGLNDRIAFVKHLFDGSTEDFNRVISQLNTLTSELEALEFLNGMVKPEYNNWAGKEEYEQRFLSFIEGKF